MNVETNAGTFIGWGAAGQVIGGAIYMGNLMDSRPNGTAMLIGSVLLLVGFVALVIGIQKVVKNIQINAIANVSSESHLRYLATSRSEEIHGLNES